MKKQKPAQKEKGFLALAGEAFVVLGEEIIEGKDKVVEVAADKFTAVKKRSKRSPAKKRRLPGPPPKKQQRKLLL